MHTEAQNQQKIASNEMHLKFKKYAQRKQEASQCQRCLTDVKARKQNAKLIMFLSLVVKPGVLLEACVTHTGMISFMNYEAEN